MIKQTLVSVCALLNKHHVDYLVIGGIAVIFHGYTRATADLDFWYKPSIDNFQKIVKAFDEYGIDVSSLNNIVFDPRKTFLRLPTKGLTSKFLPVIPGELSFTEAKSNAEILEWDGVSIPVIGYNDLIKNKKLSNRLRDLADIEELEKRRKRSRD